MKKFRLFPILLLIACTMHAQNEIQVNTAADSTQRQPAVARDGAGNYTVVWKSEAGATLQNRSDIYLQHFLNNDTKSGSEVRVNTTLDGEQEKPVIAVNSSGSGVVAWVSLTAGSGGYDIYARRLQNGVPQGNEFLVNTYIQNTQNNPSAAINANGEFVVCWDSWYQDGSDRGVYAQRFTAAGVKAGDEFRVNVETAYSQARPVVKYFPNGNILFLWESYKPAPPSPAGYDVYGRVFSTNGTATTGDFLVNTVTANSQWFADAAIFSDNSFVAVWCSWEQDGDDGGIYYQRFLPDGTKLGGEFRVNKSTAFYQWLAKVEPLAGNKFAVIWSSWKQDGSREGIYASYFDENENRYTLEERINTTTESFQWEPDFVVTPTGEMLAVWSSYNQFGPGYDIAARRVKLIEPVGVLNPVGYIHTAGSSTAAFLVQAADSTAMTGHTYEISFDTTTTRDSLYASIKDLQTTQTVIQNFPLNRGPNITYTTPVFDGIAVEFNPVYNLQLDTEGSYFVNNSGSNLIYSYSLPTAGTRLLAPVDIVIVWGTTDTLPDGKYVTPVDTATGLNGLRDIITPFSAFVKGTNTKVSLLVREPAANRNKKWDAGEDIVFITPPPYQQTAFNTHAQILNAKPVSSVVLPSVGDTHYVLTKRPVTPQDKFRFTAAAAAVVTGDGLNPYMPEDIRLYQNFPNPFNPSTSIRFYLPREQRVTLSVFSITGEKVVDLVKGTLSAGNHQAEFVPKAFSSGVYFYLLQTENRSFAGKMVYIK